MPRRKVIIDDQLLGNIPLALPPARRHEHERDAYEAADGAVPGKATRVQITSVTPTTPTSADLAERDQIRAEMRVAATRYNRYLDALHDSFGDQEAALAAAYNLPIEEVRERFYELRVDVRRGQGATDISQVLERNDLTQADRVAIMRRHAYSANPAASLKAVDMISDMEGDSGNLGSFEDYLRTHKLQKG